MRSSRPAKWWRANSTPKNTSVMESCGTASCCTALEPNNNVFLVGATNHPENIDPSILGGHRSSEKLHVGSPGPEGCQKLLRKYLADVQLELGTTLERVAQDLSGSAPADIEAICAAAKRFAFSRMGEGRELPPLSSRDFEEAVKRVRGQY